MSEMHRQAGKERRWLIPRVICVGPVTHVMARSSALVAVRNVGRKRTKRFWEHHLDESAAGGKMVNHAADLSKLGSPQRL